MTNQQLSFDAGVQLDFDHPGIFDQPPAHDPKAPGHPATCEVCDPVAFAQMMCHHSWAAPVERADVAHYTTRPDHTTTTWAIVCRRGCGAELTRRSKSAAVVVYRRMTSGYVR